MLPAIIDKIFSPDDIKDFSHEKLSILSSEIRQRIISILSMNGGHLASNLGIVELTIALHYVFDSPKDKLLFDTSHQTYTHKILTGRNEAFGSLRRHKGIAGFSHPHESSHDHFFSGHAGTALSTALGLATARDHGKKDDHIISILGDASLTCGMTFEALNNIPKDLKKFILVLNDNDMAITKNVGNIDRILCESEPDKFFQHFGLEYLGPIDGHNIPLLIDTLEKAKEIDSPVLLHVRTVKGKGLLMARENPTVYHGAKPFDKVSGKFNASSERNKPNFSKIFGKKLVEMGEKNPSLFALSPAMLAGSGLISFQEKYPERCIDVGIAENHALAFAGALGSQKSMNVVATIYSTFLQRAFDNVFHDICLQESPILLGIDRAGLNGPDGVTHHGIFDIGFLLSMPNLILTVPRNGQVLEELLTAAFKWNKPVAIRYPNAPTDLPHSQLAERTLGQSEILSHGKDLLIISVGTFCQEAMEVAIMLEEAGISTSVVDPVFLKPFDEKFMYSLIENHPYVVTLEEHSLSYGFGMHINSFMMKNQLHKKVLNLGIPDRFTHHGQRELLLKELGLDSSSIYNRVMKYFFSSVNKTSQRPYDYCSLSQ